MFNFKGSHLPVGRRIVAAFLAFMISLHLIAPTAQAALAMGMSELSLGNPLSPDFASRDVDSMTKPKVLPTSTEDYANLKESHNIEELEGDAEHTKILEVPILTESEDLGVFDAVYEEGEILQEPELEPIPYAGGDIIVRYKEPPKSRAGIGRMGEPKVAHDLELLQVGKGDDVEAVLAQLQKDPKVEYAEKNYKLYSQEVESPNDPRFKDQWAMEEMGAIAGWEYAQDLLDLLPDEEIGGEVKEATPVTVAVIDTGVDAAHEDLKGRVLSGCQFMRGVGKVGDTDDDAHNGHGTHVAGIIAAITDNGKGIAGISGEFPVEILPVKVLDSAGVGTMYDVALGIYWAADNGAKVINLSLGARLPDYPRTLAEAVRYAQDKGILVVAAAGNDGGDVEGFYPACLPGVVPAAATGEDHRVASFSNWGPENVNAPGVDIISTLPRHHYGSLSGTSQAAGFVSGVAAVLWSVHPRAGQGDIAEILREGDRSYQYNILSLYSALEELYSGTVPVPYYLWIVSPEADFNESPRVSGVIDLTVRVSNPAMISRLEFTLIPEHAYEPRVLGEVDGETMGESGLFTLSWDTSEVPNGLYRLEVTSYDKQNKYLTDKALYVIVDNQRETSLIVEVKKPDDVGTPASGAWVTVQHAYPDPVSGEMIYEELWNDAADLEGKVILPSTLATFGNNFLITAQGTDPYFFYYKVVKAPGHVVLDAGDAKTFTISAKPDEGPLSRAIVLLELLGGICRTSSIVWETAWWALP